MRPPVGAATLDERPEAAGVVRLAQVAQLVHYDVVEHLERREDEAPVEGERASGRAGSPARALVADLDARPEDSELLRLLLGEHRHELTRSPARLGLRHERRIEA